MRTSSRVFWCLIFVFITAGWALAQGQAPFAPGEVAVYATPDQLPGHSVVKFLPTARITVVAAQPGRELGLVQRFRESGFTAGLNLKAHAFETVPNDPYYSPYQWHFSRVQSERAWDTASGSGVTVAVLDTGIALGGPDGITWVVQGRDVVNGDDDPWDGDGHGTHVSGTVAGATNNSIGVAGLAFGASIMPVKVLDDGGSGSFADIAEGIYWAVDNGAKVINMSLGINARFGVRNDPVMDPALDYAFANGVTVVCASGNDGSRNNVSYPAIYPTTIAVGATDYANSVTRYSNRGDGLDLVAPGGDTGKDLNGDGYGDGVLQETFINGSWGYYFFQGTSMASPHVAAAAAILMDAQGQLTPEEVLDLLSSTALDLNSPGYDSTSGWGLIQVADAISGPAAPVDSDLDGYDSTVDCNDSDPAIFPGALEICDGVDNNCDGIVDEGCGGGCTDLDGDGWCVEEGDCNDSDSHIYPGHPDTNGRWGRDGVDNDCNGTPDA